MQDGVWFKRTVNNFALRTLVSSRDVPDSSRKGAVE